MLVEEKGDTESVSNKIYGYKYKNLHLQQPIIVERNKWFKIKIYKDICQYTGVMFMLSKKQIQHATLRNRCKRLWRHYLRTLEYDLSYCVFVISAITPLIEVQDKEIQSAIKLCIQQFIHSFQIYNNITS
jgi:ribonuclease P protein component